uniref:CSON015515 protein n=2 Tax=Culicoides sonorensis TaxID=179676 RepID=A0A336MIY0_CULSO
MYYLPECAIQQVCNAVYVRLNYTQPLCACPPRYRDPCSASLNEDDNHTLKLIGNEQKKAITLAKTCETTTELRDCRPPRDWSILALQNTRTGKSHYLVICKCPSNYRLEGPLAHDQPTYAGLPGINVYGMLCVPPQQQQSTTQSFVSKWKENTRFPVSSYRSKNSTITAEERIDTDVNEDNEITQNENTEQENTANDEAVESETARNTNNDNVVDETTITENYAMQDEEMVEDETEATDVQQEESTTDTDDNESEINAEDFGTTEGYSFTTDGVTEDNFTE